MSKRLQSQWPTFQLIGNTKSPKFLKSILTHVSRNTEFCSACREICKNIVNRKVDFTGCQIRKLKKYKKVIYKLSKKKNSHQHKRKLVVQAGGFWPIVVPLLASVVGEILRK